MPMNANDLLITDGSGESHGYLIAAGEANPVVHTKSAPNVPLPGSTTQPTQAGGQYDVRDSDSGKAIAHLDWKLGAGQKSLDWGEANASKFMESSFIDIDKRGEIKLLRPVTDTHVENTAGPVFSALGCFWMGTALGTLKYSNDKGANWSSASIGGTAITAPIGGFATDGTKVYFCVPSGASKGIWANTAAAIGTFAKFGATGTTEEVRHLAYHSGFLLAATNTRVAMVDTTTGVFSTSSAQRTPSFLNSTMTSVALVTAGNAVYWVVSQGSNSYVYCLTIDANASTMLTQQYLEMPTGFIATCALGYLSTIYVGGYYESSTSGVGKGAVYVAADGYAAPLFEIGDLPEQTPVPAAAENDNRIYAICSASKDFYVLTNNACYRWDIDDTGYSHAFDFLGAGYSELTLTWADGSAISWDGTDPGGGKHMPAGYTVTETGTETGTWDYTGAIATLSNATPATKWALMSGVCTPTAGEVFNNANGTTVEIAMGAASEGQCLEVTLKDGTREARLVYGVTISGYNFLYSLWYGSPEAGKWCSGAWILLDSGSLGAHTINMNLKGNKFTVTVDGVSTIAHNNTKANTATNSLKLDCYAGTQSPTVSLCDATVLAAMLGGWRSSVRCAIDSILVNNAGWQAAGTTLDAVFRPSIAYSKGNLLAPYAVATDAKSLTITALSKASPTQITTSAPHGIAAGGTQVVNISGSNSVPVADGNYLATYVDSTKFTVPFNVATTAGTTGAVKYNHNAGWTVSGTGYAPSGYLTQSATNFHSGSILKDFRYIAVAHDSLPAGSTLSMQWWVDGVSGNALGVTAGQETRFTVDTKGYSIKTKLTMTHDDTGTVSPVVRSINVAWDFVKPVKHQYLLDCRNGLQRWSEDPETAIAFLFASADEQITFEDRFEGEYQGIIEQVEFAEANHSQRVGYEGLVRVSVREVS